MPLPRFLQVILRLHSSWLNLWKLYFRFGLNSVEERQGSRWFCYDCFYFFRENFWEIGKVKISQLIVVSLSRIKIHHTNIFFFLLLILLFLLFFFFPFCFFSFGRVRNTGESANLFWFSFWKKWDVGIGFVIYFMQNVEAAHVFFSEAISFFNDALGNVIFIRGGLGCVAWIISLILSVFGNIKEGLQFPIAFKSLLSLGWKIVVKALLFI